MRDVATWKKTVSPGEYDRLNQQRFITLTANIYEKDLGTAVSDVNKAIASLGELPKGVKIMVKGQADLLKETMSLTSNRTTHCYCGDLPVAGY
ncbi:MAG: hypothetical protein U5K54_11790 [Cytophagales bacterium]|nr:hypothetical protein [Cytophagales bacterium]